MNLIDQNISYLILPNQMWHQTTSYLYSKDYRIVDLMVQENESMDKSMFVYSDVDNVSLKKDTLFVLNHFDIDYGYIKYSESSEIYKIYKSGDQIEVQLGLYESNDNKRYIIGSLFFSFKVLDKYYLVEKKEQIKPGMEIEYFNNNKWSKKIVENVDLEWTKLYSLLSKYKKLRIKESLV